jgi:hypothetical protein
MKRANQQALKESSSDSYSLEFWVNPGLNHSICVGHEINRIKNLKNKKKAPPQCSFQNSFDRLKLTFAEVLVMPLHLLG